MARTRVVFETFERDYLIEDFRDRKGNPKHTRLVKDYFYRFAKELLVKYKFDIHKCSNCGIQEWLGRALVMELDHINSITNDSRIENLRPLCPNCHSQTDGFRNRHGSVCDHVDMLKGKSI